MINLNDEKIFKYSTKRKMMFYFGFTAILLSFICCILGVFVSIRSPDVIIDIIMSSFAASGFCSATVAAEYFSKNKQTEIEG